MLGMMNGKRISVQSDNELNAKDIIVKGVREKSDIHAIASKGANSICVLVWNYHDDDLTGPASPVEITINGIANDKVLVQHYRVDQQFSNSFEKWKAMGKPQQLTDEEYRVLEKSGHLQLYTSPEWKKTNKGDVVLTFDLSRQGVSLLHVTW
jgi:xylan 1,4-beta-xylosidase